MKYFYLFFLSIFSSFGLASSFECQVAPSTNSAITSQIRLSRDGRELLATPPLSIGRMYVRNSRSNPNGVRVWTGSITGGNHSCPGSCPTVRFQFTLSSANTVPNAGLIIESNGRTEDGSRTHVRVENGFVCRAAN